MKIYAVKICLDGEKVTQSLEGKNVVVFEKSWEKEDEYNQNVLDKILKELIIYIKM